MVAIILAGVTIAAIVNTCASNLATSAVGTQIVALNQLCSRCALLPPLSSFPPLLTSNLLSSLLVPVFSSRLTPFPLYLSDFQQQSMLTPPRAVVLQHCRPAKAPAGYRRGRLLRRLRPRTACRPAAPGASARPAASGAPAPASACARDRVPLRTAAAGCGLCAMSGRLCR